ncbi:MAG: tetraacyldisaccharide 4'-kinase [Planctomycetota bacterium]|nr:tetraacyldisaccharide 4'-kinase [Planctomycetota bacterium]MCX8040388.1 tetraacyldisaccharide 4'-kinase [Planctomycetota bacterium]MDW8373764.1 tetraacyldisaccharide 4'-kinase [Planctomycetota bacterium]
MSAPPILRLAGRRWEEIPEAPWRWLLVPAWAVYGAAVAVRALAYDARCLPIHRLPAPVISVGNVLAGGTGKTPVALAVARLLAAQGRRPCILARGYRGHEGRNDEAALAGELPVLCDPDRVRAGRRALAQGADCLVLDDGLQHRRLHRDLDIVVIDATRPWGDPRGGPGWLLPLGYRRDLRCAIARCQVAWITRGHLHPARAEALASALAQRGLVVVRQPPPRYRLRTLHGEEAAPPAGPVLAVSGIGHPAAFEADVQRAGLRVRACLRFPDHHRYTARDAERIARGAGAHPVIVTAKDAVKLAAWWQESWPPCLVLASDAELAPADRARLLAVLDRALASAAASTTLALRSRS